MGGEGCAQQQRQQQKQKHRQQQQHYQNAPTPWPPLHTALRRPVYADCGYVGPPVLYDISAKTQTEQQLLEMDMDAPMPTLPSG